VQEHEEEGHEMSEHSAEDEVADVVADPHATGRFKVPRLPSSEILVEKMKLPSTENLLFGPPPSPVKSASSDNITAPVTKVPSTDNIKPFGESSSPGEVESSNSIGSFARIPIVSLFKFHIDTSDTAMSFMRRFVSTQVMTNINIIFYC
jgi:hypothetical protein